MPFLVANDIGTFIGEYGSSRNRIVKEIQSMPIIKRIEVDSLVEQDRQRGSHRRIPASKRRRVRTPHGSRAACRLCGIPISKRWRTRRVNARGARRWLLQLNCWSGRAGYGSGNCNERTAGRIRSRARIGFVTPYTNWSRYSRCG